MPNDVAQPDACAGAIAAADTNVRSDKNAPPRGDIMPGQLARLSASCGGPRPQNYIR